MSDPQRPPSAESAAEPVQDETFTVLDLILVLVRHRRLIVVTTGIVAVVLFAYNIAAISMDPESPWNVLPAWFTASVTVAIADDGPHYGAGAASLLAPGTRTNASRAQELLAGREIRDALARRQGGVTDASSNDAVVLARRRLAGNLDTRYLLESDLLVISYDHLYPDQAAAGLEFAVQRLREKMHALTIERVRRRKVFLEERLAAVRQDRTDAQDALTAFQRKFGVVNLTAQSESVIDNVTRLKTELYRKEVEFHSQIELLGENSAAVVPLRSEVDKLRTLIREMEHGFVEFQDDSTIPLQELPALGVRYLDLATELSVHDTIYAFLRTQYESALIEEDARESAFQIVAAVGVPLRKSRPDRALICIVGTLGAFMASVLAAFAAERFRRAESDPVQSRQLDEIRREIGFRRKRTGPPT